MVLSIHHVLYDGTSLPVILKSVADNYLNIKSEEAVQPLIAFLRILTTPDERNATQFWRQYLSDITIMTPRTPTAISKPLTAVKKLNLSLNEVKQRAANLQITLNALLCAIFGLTISPGDSDEVVFGVSVLTLQPRN
jgi:NRPS condensation-like uncharacterized protein